MKIKSIGISERVLSRFPSAAMGYVIAGNVTNETSNSLEETINFRLKLLNDLQSPEQSETIRKWRNIFIKMNAKKGKISSIESLISMYLENKKLPNINPVVNYYNSLSCFLGLPMGAYDIDGLPDSEITLREARKNEEFVPIGGKTLEKTSNGEIIYSSGATVICKLWNNKDADISKILLESKNILFIFDGADDKQKNKITEGIKFLREELELYFGAEIKSSGILHTQQNKVDF